MPSHLLGCIEIDESNVREDIERSSELQFQDVYGEFLCGYPWKSCMLWSTGAEVGDGVIAHYDITQPAGFTPYGERLPHLRALIAEHFAVEHLLFARLALMTDSVLVPHRDYVEFDGAAPPGERVGHRVHVPLVTSDDCYFTEENLVFRMRVGEVWYLDVTRCHSAAVLSDIKRFHLILDFSAAADGARLLPSAAPAEAPVPAASRHERPALTDDERGKLLALSSVMDRTNLRDILAIVTKKHYFKDGGDDFVWDTFEEIGKLSSDPAIGAEVAALREYYLLARDE